MTIQKLLDTEDLPFCVESERENVFIIVWLSASRLSIANNLHHFAQRVSVRVSSIINHIRAGSRHLLFP